MPSITILEQDLTKGGGSSDNLNIVYVPGCIGYPTDKVTPDAHVDTPILCETIEQFERHFGASPANISIEDENGGTTFVIDKSYVYAKELLDLGMPVLYEGIFDSADGDIALEDIENKLAGAYTDDNGTVASPYAKLVDRGEYDFKYLTSGGYSNYTIPKEDSPKLVNIITEGYINDALLYIQQDTKTRNNNEYTFSCKKVNGNGTSNWEVTMKDGTNLTLEDASDPGKIITSRSLSLELKMLNAKDTSPTMYNEKYDIGFFQVDISDGIDLTVGDTIEVKTSLEYNEDNEPLAEYPTVTTSYTFENAATSSPILSKMTSVAYNRGDCIVLVDHENNEDMNLIGEESFHEAIVKEADGLRASDCCAAFTPWVNINCSTYTPKNKGPVSMPPSFAYLAALANSLRTNASWLAVAGATRGQIPGLNGTNPLNINKVLTNSIAENEYQNRDGISINAITNIKPFGYRIWGNRTLKNNAIEKDLTATSFLNTRNMICDVKKVAFDACRRLMFEQNNDVLWLNFKAAVEPTLEKMKSGAGLAGYKVVKGTTTQKAKLIAQIKLYPLYAVEDFEITVQMIDEDIQVS